jgi:hypothetical protein
MIFVVKKHFTKIEGKSSLAGAIPIEHFFTKHWSLSGSTRRASTP